MSWSRAHQGAGRLAVRAPLVLLLVLAAGGWLAARSDAQRPARAVAEAAAVAAPAGDAARIATRDGLVVADGAASLPGVTTAGGSVTVDASTEGGTGRARAAATVRGVSLLDGLVRASRVRRVMTATAAGTSTSGDVRNLRVGDTVVGDVTATRTFELPDGAGILTVNAAQEGLVVELARAVAGARAGSRIVIVETQATARDAVAAPPPAPTATPTRPDPTPGSGGGTVEPQSPGREQGDDPEATPTPSAQERAERRRRAAERAEQRRQEREIARLAAGDFTFPVAGPTTFSDDWGGARQIGPHQGNDLFAPFGAPVVAVADGTIAKVGTLPISGNRLWLRTPENDAFFYAHMASFAAGAEPGRRVKAGTVLGYIGNTGDAEPTPPHLHFEAHPAGGDAVNPYVALTAWQEASGVAGDADAAAEQPGALVEVRDLIAG